MIEMHDGAVLAQMGTPDMRIPIAYALTYPDRENSNARKLDFIKDAGNMTFEKPDMDKFPCLAIAIEAAKRGGTYPAAMNGANEELVARFLDNKIRFMDIPGTLERIMDHHKVQNDLSIEVILEADRQARREVAELLD
jgi:1-deoxy-D-xylulose-5-phosphate reductoisomerase